MGRPKLTLLSQPRSRWSKWKHCLRIGIACFFGFPFLLAAGIWLRYRVRSVPPPIKGQVLFARAVYDREMRRLPRPLVLHVVTVDLATPGLRFLVTPPDDAHSALPLRGRTTSAFLRESGADLAINGDFYYPWKSNSALDYYPHVGDGVTVQGYASSNGVPYGDNTARWKLPALCFSASGEASIRVVKRGDTPPHNAIGGNLFLLQKGQVTEASRADTKPGPRTAVSLDHSGGRLIMIIVDGRQAGYSEGVTAKELALLLQERGGYTAINLDGGGSTTLVVRDKAGAPQVLNSPINHFYFPHEERVVANHLALFAAPPKTVNLRGNTKRTENTL